MPTLQNISLKTKKENNSRLRIVTQNTNKYQSAVSVQATITNKYK